MREINIRFDGEEDKKQFVSECEKDFEKHLTEASLKVIQNNYTNVLLAGPTCSGKTTTAAKIISELKQAGREVTVISFDDFFKERKDRRQVDHSKKIDYESVDVLDLDFLKECIQNAYPGKKIKVPVFDFVTQTRSGMIEHTIDEKEVIVYEGIQAVYPEISALFGKEYTGIFINVNEDVMINGVYFSKEEIRLARRIVRDKKFRGATAEFTLFLWETVRENEKNNIFPNKNICSIQLESFLPYELFVLKKYFLDAISDISEGSLYYRIAEKMRNKFENIESISYEYVPENSLYTEFLGKKQ